MKTDPFVNKKVLFYRTLPFFYGLVFHIYLLYISPRGLILITSIPDGYRCQWVGVGCFLLLLSLPQVSLNQVLIITPAEAQRR